MAGPRGNCSFSLIPQQRYTRSDADARRNPISRPAPRSTRSSEHRAAPRASRPGRPGAAARWRGPGDPAAVAARADGYHARAIPTSMLPQLTLEIDLAVQRLEKLAGEGLGQEQPSAPPRSTGAVPGAPGFHGPVGRRRGWHRTRRRGPGPDFRSANPDRLGQPPSLAAGTAAVANQIRRCLIPDQRDLVLSGSNGHNGNGRH